MAALTTSSAVDSLLQSATNHAIRTATGGCLASIVIRGYPSLSILSEDDPNGIIGGVTRVSQGLYRFTVGSASLALTANPHLSIAVGIIVNGAGLNDVAQAGFVAVTAGSPGTIDIAVDGSGAGRRDDFGYLRIGIERL